jgi:hypothetical protein
LFAAPTKLPVAVGRLAISGRFRADRRLLVTASGETHAMRRLRLRILRLAAALVGVAALAWACNAPFIPVPPPGMISFSSQLVSDGNGGQKTVWITQGGPNTDAALAIFYVFDAQQGAGVITTAAADGSFRTLPMDGAAGDQVHIYYRRPKGDYSLETCRVITEGVPDAPLCQ